MKIFTSILMVITLLVSCFGLKREAEKPVSEIENLYADVGVIMDDPGKIGDDVIITMQNGNMFAFENDDGDCNIGNLVSVLLDNNGTENVYDDIIVDYIYAGWISESEMKIWIKEGK